MRAFLSPRWKQRCLELLKTPMGRRTFFYELEETAEFDSRFCTDWSQWSTEEAEAALRSAGAPDVCYVMAHENRVVAELDQKTMFLHDALLKCANLKTRTYIVSCIPGHLALVENYWGQLIVMR